MSQCCGSHLCRGLSSAVLLETAPSGWSRLSSVLRVTLVPREVSTYPGPQSPCPSSGQVRQDDSDNCAPLPAPPHPSSASQCGFSLGESSWVSSVPLNTNDHALLFSQVTSYFVFLLGQNCPILNLKSCLIARDAGIPDLACPELPLTYSYQDFARLANQP